MKKASFLTLIVLVSMIIAPSVVQAATVPFNIITSQSDDFQPSKKYSITFAPEVTLNAETVRGAKVNLTVYYDDEPDMDPEVYDEVVVGASCKYIQVVDLELGSNTLELRISKNGMETRKIAHIIKRKDETVLKSLQSMIVIPEDK